MTTNLYVIADVKQLEAHQTTKARSADQETQVGMAGPCAAETD